VSIKGPQYANVDYTARASAAVERIFESLPEYTGSFFVNGFGGQNMAFGGSVLKDWDQRTRSATDIQGLVYGAGQSVLGASVTPFQPAPLPASSSGLPFQMVLRSTGDFHRLYQDMETFKARARQSGLFAFVDSNLAFDSPEARIEIDQSKAGELGVTMAAIADTLAVLVGENYINRFNFHDRSYDVIPQVLGKDRLTPRDLGDYYVRSRSGTLVPLSSLMRVDLRPAPNGLPQFDQMNAATLSAVLAPGVTMGQAVAYMAALPVPIGDGIDWLADSRQYVHEGNRLTLTFGFAIVVIFLVLAAQFESLRDPLVILTTVPLAICGALLPLYLGFATINIYTQIGLVTLVGLISKHGILIVAFANELQRSHGLDREQAVLQAAMVRMRPILMTTAAMVAGLVPLLFAAGAGAESRFAIGIVVVMGMLVGTFFTLFVLPTIYTLLAGDHRQHPAEDALIPDDSSAQVGPMGMAG
jgi:multidrug efflux pump